MLDSLKFGLGGFIAGAVACFMALALWQGWKSPSAAEHMAKKYAEEAVVKVMTPVCVERFKSLPNVAEELEKLKAMRYAWDRRSAVEKAGWAGKSPSSALTEECAEAILQVSL